MVTFHVLFLELIMFEVWLNSWVFVYELSGCRFESRWSHLNFRFRACLERGALDIQATIECEFTLKRVRDMIRTYSQMYSTKKYSQHSPIIWPVWLNGWVFVYDVSGCGFQSHSVTYFSSSYVYLFASYWKCLIKF